MDPNFALALVGIADIYNTMGLYGLITPKESVKYAKAAIERALEINPALAEAYAAKGYMITLHVWNWPEAEKYCKRALDLNPNHVIVHLAYAMYLLAMKRFDEAIVEAKLALDLDPLSLVISAVVGMAYICSGMYDQAIKQLDRSIEIDPDYPTTYWIRGNYYTMKRMWDEAVEDRIRHVKLMRGTPLTLGALGYTYALSGKKNEALKVKQQLNKLSKNSYVSAFCFALIYLGLGDNDKAIENLEKAYEERFSWMIYIAADDFFKDIRSDHRFKALLMKMGLPE